MAKVFYIMPKWRNLAKSDHSGGQSQFTDKSILVSHAHKHLIM